MRLLALFMYGGQPQPQSAASGDGWHAPLDPVATALFLCLLFGIPMLGLFWLGCGELYDWYQRRGWRAAKHRRPLK